MLSDCEKSYIAGLIDNKRFIEFGTKFRYRRNKKRIAYFIRADIEDSSNMPLLEILNFWNYHSQPYLLKKAIRYTDDDLFFFLSSLRPFLKNQKERVEIALKILKIKENPPTTTEQSIIFQRKQEELLKQFRSVADKPLEKQEKEEFDLHYIAGLFDDSGSFSARCEYRYKEKRSNRKTIHKTYHLMISGRTPCLQFVQTYFGGTLVKNKNCNAFNLRFKLAEAEKFLKTITPYLRIKKNNANCFSKLLRFRLSDGNHKKFVDHHLKELQIMPQALNLKKCIKCQCALPEYSFPKNLRSCKECLKQKYRNLSPTEKRKYYLDTRKYYFKNKERRLAMASKWKKEDRIKKAKDRILLDIYRFPYPELDKTTKRFRERSREKLRQIIKEKGDQHRTLTGCSGSFLTKWIEKQFQPGMSWDNRDKWDVDHIIPLSKFDFKNSYHLLLAHHYTNLQPLWKKENSLKNDKILEDVQIELPLC